MSKPKHFLGIMPSDSSTYIVTKPVFQRNTTAEQVITPARYSDTHCSQTATMTSPTQTSHHCSPFHMKL